jgi:hypothetical protein
MRRALVFAWLLFGCGSEQADPAPPCEQQCKDDNAVRAIRETMKLVYNLTLQGNPVGAQDELTPCPHGGGARVWGEATSDSMQGATFVDLSYQFANCKYIERDDEPDENYAITLNGIITQQGTIAVQPSATSALIMKSEALSLSGTVYDPPLPYEESDCVVELGQSGSKISGTICGRLAGANL